MRVQSLSGLRTPGSFKLSFLIRAFQYYLLLPLIIFTGASLLSYSTAAYATPPDVSGTYTGKLTGSGTCSPPPPATENVNADLTFTITQSGTSITGDGTFRDADDGDSGTFQFNGSIFDSSGAALVSGNVDIQSDVPQGGTFSGSFSNGTLELSFSFSDLSGTPICNFNTSGTFTRSSGDTVVVTEETPSSVLTAPVLLNTQIKAITSDLNARIGDVLRGMGIGPRQTATGFMWQGHSSGLNAGDSMTGYGVWGSYSYSDFENDFVSTAFDGYRHNFLAGVDISPWENTVAGIALGYEGSDIDTGFNRGNQETDGFTVAPYFGYLLTDNLSIDASIGYSSIDSDQFRTDPGTGATVTSSPDSDRYFGAVNLNGFTTYENWLFSGRFGFLHARNVTDAFTESDGTQIQEFRSKLGQFNVGGEAAYGMGQFEPFTRLTYEHDFSLTEITAATGPQPSNDNDNFLFGAGVRYFGANGLSGNLEYNKRFGRDDFDEDIFMATLRMDF